MKVIYASGKHSDKQIMVSDCDYDFLSKTKWYIVEGYAYGYINKKLVKMHRVVLNAQPGEIGDHIDRIKLNNQRENLRIVTQAQNVHNSDRSRKNRKRMYTGVQFQVLRNSFRAFVTRGTRTIASECFKTALAAAIKYNRLLIENNLDGVPNPISLSLAQQDEILLRDSLKKKRSEFQSGIKCVTYNKSSKDWLYRKTVNGKRILIGCRQGYSDIVKLYNELNQLST